jgi:hypothetical protein
MVNIPNIEVYGYKNWAHLAKKTGKIKETGTCIN